MIDKHKIGMAGEEFAAQWLAANGFSLLHRNWRQGRYELDIVATKYGVIHFIEVKTRKAGGLTTPEEALDRRKQQSLKRAASLYLAIYRVSLEPQFDLMAVEHYPDGHFEVRYEEDVIQSRW